MSRVVADVEALRAACATARDRGERVGLVPTMGFLHEGHRSLMRAARAENDFVVVTVFVNPLQFGPGEDLDRYPRDLDADVAACAEERVDLVFAPSVDEMYPQGSRTTVHVAELTEPMCGAARPGHFDGVTTIVAKLFAVAGPCRAYFGRKDAQQLAVVTRMAADLDLPVTVVGCPLVREADGLALSSRNAYLAPDQRRAATVLHRALAAGAAMVVAGSRRPGDVVGAVRDVLAGEPLVVAEYVELRDARDLREVERLDGELLLALAARVGSTRLIDNVRLTVHDDTVEIDDGVVAATS